MRPLASKWRAVLVAAALLACRREPEKASEEKPELVPKIQPAAAAMPAPTSSPTALHGMPGALGLASEQVPTAVAKAALLKNTGQLGERLEGDVYAFELLSMARCGAPVGEAAAATGGDRAVIGAKVRIRAKSRLAVSPRDVTLRRGGVTFYASLDAERRLKGCAPLLKLSSLREKQAAEGFVLFDVPVPEPEGLELEYRPTRWGGASQVRVALGTW